MGGPQSTGRVKRRKYVTRKHNGARRTKDLDQIHEDLQPTNVIKLVNQSNEDLPGLGQNYCIACARHFVSPSHLQRHFDSKPHKKRVSALKDSPYTDLESQIAAGMGLPDNGPKIITQLPEATPLPSTLDPALLRQGVPF
ncbi:hypothetical protein RCL1_007254 [Eukaryota sp. TZLM3-RCL]